MTKTNRQGAIGALLDIYEQAISALKNVITDISDNTLTRIIDTQTSDEHCRSVQGILSHVVHSGYGYATNIANLNGHSMKRPDMVFRATIEEYQEDLTNLFIYTENIFKELEDNDLEQFDNACKIKTGWGQVYDIEQMTEHAIVHILRHKRQIANITASL